MVPTWPKPGFNVALEAKVAFEIFVKSPALAAPLNVQENASESFSPSVALPVKICDPPTLMVLPPALGLCEAHTGREFFATFQVRVVDPTAFVNVAVITSGVPDVNAALVKSLKFTSVATFDPLSFHTIEQFGSFGTIPKLVTVVGANETRRLVAEGVAELTAQFRKTSTGHAQVTVS